MSFGRLREAELPTSVPTTRGRPRGPVQVSQRDDLGCVLAPDVALSFYAGQHPSYVSRPVLSAHRLTSFQSQISAVLS